QPFKTEDFLKIAFQCVEALKAAHQQNILHSDIKPENIMLTSEGQVKVLDFGVAKRLPVSGLEPGWDTLKMPDRRIEGTPAYMAPEVLQARQADGRADIFSLGVVFYEML